MSASTRSGRVRGRPIVRWTRRCASSGNIIGASPAWPGVSRMASGGAVRRPRRGSSCSARRASGRGQSTDTFQSTRSLHRVGPYAAQHLLAPRGGRDGGDAVVRGETGDQTDQESRSAGHGAAPIMTAMDITIHASFLPHDDPDASWPSIATPSASRSGTTSDTAGCAGSRSAPPASPTRPSSCIRRSPPPASPTTSAAPSPR